MGFLMLCGICCACMSVWAIIQLGFMGMFYYIETPILIEDVEEHHAESFKAFIDKTRANYAQNALNCWTTAGCYAITLALSILCIQLSRSKSKKQEKIMEDDDLACVAIHMPQDPVLVAAPLRKTTSPRSSPHQINKTSKDEIKAGMAEKAGKGPKTPNSGKSSHTELPKSPKSGRGSKTNVPGKR